MHGKKKEGQTRKRSIKKMILWTLLGIVLVVLAGAGYYGATVDLQSDDDVKQTDYLSPKSEPIAGTTATQH
jgi:flagellar basal body-associated protein FliL